MQEKIRNLQAFDEHGKPDLKKVLDREIKSKHECQRSPELEKILKEFDFNLLKSILKRHLALSGVNPEQLNFLGLESINEAKEPFRFAWYDPFGNVINISFKKIVLACKFYKRNVNILIYQILIHEEVHAASKISSIQKPGNTSMELGYSRYESPIYRAWMAVNEAMTEMLARDIFEEYNIAVNLLSSEDRLKTKGIEENEGAYVLERKFVKLFISKLSMLTEIDEKDIKNAFIRGMFEGASLEEDDIKEFLTSHFSTDFLKKVKSSSKRAIELATAELEGRETEPKLKDLILAFQMLFVKY